MSDSDYTASTQAGYDRVAAQYTARIFDELQHKPLDRELLERFARQVQGLGPVCDLGCGPGHVARYLHEQGVPVFGLDLSPQMLAQARRMSPAIEFRQGDMLALEAEDASWGGIAAFYSIIHIARADVPRALRELWRVLRPDGVLLLAFHLGDEVVHVDEWWGEPVSLDFCFFTRAEMEGYLRAAGFEIDQSLERDPYPDIEHQSRRAYVSARKNG